MSNDTGGGRFAPILLALSAAGLVSIAAHEGYTDKAVIPVKGDKPTLGFGTTQGVKMGDTTTPPKALARALIDVQKFEGPVRECVKVPLYQREYDAFVSLAYNVGIGKSGVADGFCYVKRGGYSTLVTRLNAGDYLGACAAILDWRYYQKKDCSLEQHRRLCGGLWTRRQHEYASCMGVTP